MPQSHGRDFARAGEHGEWLIESPRSKGWLSRQPATQTSAVHPGTAVSWDGDLFEVVSSETAGAGVTYTLVPWSDRHTIRVLDRYDEESETMRSTVLADDRRRAERRRLLLLLSPLAGHLPADVQDGWERDYDVPASLLTIISALPLFVFGILCSLSLTIQGFTGVVLLPLSLNLLFFGTYLMFESGLRLSRAWGQRRPAGSVAGTLARVLWERGVRPMFRGRG